MYNIFTLLGISNPAQPSSPSAYSKLHLSEALTWANDQPEFLIDLISLHIVPRLTSKQFHEVLRELLTDSKEETALWFTWCIGDHTVATKKELLQDYEKIIGRHIKDTSLFQGVFRNMVLDCFRSVMWRSYHEGTQSMVEWIQRVLEKYFAQQEEFLKQVLRSLEPFQPLPYYERPPEYSGGRKVRLTSTKSRTRSQRHTKSKPKPQHGRTRSRQKIRTRSRVRRSKH